MLSDKKGSCHDIYVLDYCVFDMETTGVSPESDRVVEISVVKVKNGKIIHEFGTLVNPGMPIPDNASRINGITDDMVADSPFFEHVLEEFMDFVGNMVLVGHNIHAFDMKFLYRDAYRNWGKTIGNDYVDTLRIARAYLPDLEHHRLVDLAEYYEIPSDVAHTALNDCRMNQLVYERLAKELSDPSEAARKVRKCPLCGSVLRSRSGRDGEFIGCTGYPECAYTEKLCG